MGGLVIPQSVKTHNGSMLTIEGQSGALAGEAPLWNPATKRAEWGPVGGVGAKPIAVGHVNWTNVVMGTGLTGPDGTQLVQGPQYLATQPAGAPTIDTWCTTSGTGIQLQAGTYELALWCELAWTNLADAPAAVSLNFTNISSPELVPFMAKQGAFPSTVGGTKNGFPLLWRSGVFYLAGPTTTQLRIATNGALAAVASLAAVATARIVKWS